MEPDTLKQLHARIRRNRARTSRAPKNPAGRPRGVYAHRGVTLSAAEWAVALGLMTTQAFYSRISAHLRNPRKYPAHWVFSVGGHRPGRRGAKVPAPRPPKIIKEALYQRQLAEAPAAVTPRALTEAEQKAVADTLAEFLK